MLTQTRIGTTLAICVALAGCGGASSGTTTTTEGSGEPATSGAEVRSGTPATLVAEFDGGSHPLAYGYLVWDPQCTVGACGLEQQGDPALYVSSAPIDCAALIIGVNPAVPDGAVWYAASNRVFMWRAGYVAEAGRFEGGLGNPGETYAGYASGGTRLGVLAAPMEVGAFGRVRLTSQEGSVGMLHGEVDVQVCGLPPT